MATELAYFADTYAFTGASHVVDVIDTASVDSALAKQLQKHPHAAILKSTVFYPQGGGQPTDCGEIRSASGTLSVAHVFMHDGLVYHQGQLAGALTAGDAVELRVDEDTRRRNARCHSAGHVIFSLVKHYWGDSMRERKGHHFSDGAYVEFDGLLPSTETVDSVQRLVDQVVADDRRVLVTGNQVRVVQVEGFVENPCGGTHVRSTGELGKITIRKIARKSGQNTTKISYQV
ncbi:hypothetical protein IWW55_000529 [Coemansia sp. RSA 2706]|nr:hypothetical protein IWW55_000529 [Coemansia sp. RSA 2706]KAJ2329579.1 hypothetical protein IWW51_000520 [Coemansia sp. RSA 2702]